MGVHGLWKLIEPSGKPVPLETLENKVLAVDVSIWLHHAVKGFQDSRGAAVPNAHLISVFHRICKLLYFRIKPVFVFDGGAPILKKQTIAKRQQQKFKTLSEADRLKNNLLSALLKHSAISKVLSEKTKAEITAAQVSPPKKPKTDEDDLFVLPPSQLDVSSSSPQQETTASSSEDDGDVDSPSPSKKGWDLHSIDTKSKDFKLLPVEMRHEILTDLKETRKQSSWGRLHELPSESGNFSGFQMQRLLKRWEVQSALQETEQEMGGHSLSLAELEKLMNEQGVITNHVDVGNRIASDENTRYLLIKDLKKTAEEAKRSQTDTISEDEEEAQNPKPDSIQLQEIAGDPRKCKAEEEFEDDLKTAIALSLQEEPSTSQSITYGSKNGDSFFKNLGDADYQSDSNSADEEESNAMSSAKSYMLEYSGLSAHAVEKILSSRSKTKHQKSIKDIIRGIPEESVSHQHDLSRLETVDEEPIKEIKETDIQAPKSPETESEGDSDFVDVDSNEDAFEVIIKPDECLEDDLFKDVFEDSEDVSKTPVAKAIEIEDEEPSRKPDEPSSEVADIFEESPEKRSESLKKNISNIIEQYSKTQESKRPQLSVQQLQEMQENVGKEQQELSVQRASKERMAGNITEQMCQEIQELLHLFGVPYLVAPMEAEAQCAFLDLTNLTDGTITDDSDIWLFGGTTVYKNFFNQSKLVMEFRSDLIQNLFKLNREQMILLAMLVGSDYTVGLQGVGPVTALEILAAFPPKSLPSQLLSGLREFRSWFDKGKAPGPSRTSLRSKLKNLKFTDNFPSSVVAEAYLEPVIDNSEEKFSWSPPDITALTDYARRKFGWSKIKCEEVLQPVTRRIHDQSTQKNITDYFKRTQAVVNLEDAEQKMSKRVKAALNKIGKSPQELAAEEDEKLLKKKTRKPRRKRKIQEEDEDMEILKKTATVSKKRVTEITKEIEEKLNGETSKKTIATVNLHRKEVIPQKQKDKSDLLKNKLKAIETFRKSKNGPGFVKTRGKLRQKKPQEDASYLSDDESD